MSPKRPLTPALLTTDFILTESNVEILLRKKSL